MAKKAYQIRITLKGSKPRIWRKVLVPADLLLSDFHKVIQTTMGWSNDHLHQFTKNRTHYRPKVEKDNFWGISNDVDYSKIKISDLLKKEKDKMTYEYDFGDGWQHDIVLEKIEEKDVVPVCLGGKNNCPPEDCGGIWGYYDMLEVLKDPEHEEYEDYVEWLGEEFDPAYFDKDAVNEMLKTDNYGCFEFFAF